jgi:acetolactate synthase-1/3 small subunit
MKKRWISLFVENDIGVLAKISGLFSGKSYNLESLTVGTTEDPTMSRITIGLKSDDITFEQIKKQLNRSVEVIKVIDLTNIPTHMKEILFIKIRNCTKEDKAEIFQIAGVFKASVADYGTDSILLECVQTETRNDDIIRLLTNQFTQVEVVRGGSVAIESISMSDR